MGQTWLCSDLHLGHELVARLRGFKSVREHDEVVLENLRSCVEPDDDLWILGDVVA